MVLKINPLHQKGKQIVLFLIIVLTHLFLLASLKFTAWPEMQLWPYLILKGWLPYKDIAIAHTPALLLELSLFNLIFGVGLWQLKAYTWTIILATDAVLFLVVKRLWNLKIAFLSLLSFIFFQVFFEGNGLWFDLVLGFYAITIYYLMKKKDFIWAGVFWTFALLSKQTAAWFLFPAFLMILERDLVERGKKFVIGVALVVIPFFLIIYAFGIWPDFWYWALKFGVGILPQASDQINLPTLKQVTKVLLPLSVLVFLPFVRRKKDNFEIVTWVIFGSMGVFPRWELFHFQPALPFLAIATGIVILSVKKLKPILLYTFGGYLLLTTILISRFYLREWGQVTRFYEGNILEIVSYLKDNTQKGEDIFVVNTWDSIYAMSGTVPATKPWFPQLPWYIELSGVQEEMIKDLAENKPKMIIVRPYTEAGLSSHKPEIINEFIKENYQEIDKIGGHLIFTPI